MWNKRALLVISGLILVNLFFLLWFFQVLTSVESRSCIYLYDPIHDNLYPFDLSIFIFCSTYIPVLFLLIDSIRKPQLIILFGIGYALIILTRIIGIYFVPLCAPYDAIPLNDEILNGFFYPNGYSALDLFYSGHTATIFLVYLCRKNLYRKFIFPLLIILPAMLMVQHVHYLVDILAAFPITYIIFFIAKKTFNFAMQTEFAAA